MFLEREQEEGLDGERGPAIEWALRTLCRLGDDTGAARLVPVRSAHVPGWCGRRFPVPPRADGTIEDVFAVMTTANPGGGAETMVGEKSSWERRGLRISYTCTPYLVGNHAGRGEAVAWGGRAAVSFANSIMGARSEMESFESATASAVTGLTPERGAHLDRGRDPTVALVVPDGTEVDLALLGWSLARSFPREVPLICGIRPTFDEAKRLAFAVNFLGTIPFFRMQRGTKPPAGMETISIDEKLTEPANGPVPDLVILGCPHLSEQEINRWSKKLSDRPPSRAEVWFFTSRLCMEKCPVFGAVLRSRGKMFVDRCPLSMKEGLAGKAIACDSPALAECLCQEGFSAYYMPEAGLLELMVRSRQ